MSFLSRKWNLFLGIIFLIWCYFCSLYLLDGVKKEFSSSIILTLLGSFALAFVVLILNDEFEQARIKKIQIEDLNKRMNLFRNILKHSFERSPSNWNFKNRKPTFYFDDSRINQIEELLSNKGREWEAFIQEYLEVKPQNNLCVILSEFMGIYNKGMIEAEKLDDLLRTQIINPTLAASKSHGDLSVRESAHSRSDLEFLVYRGRIMDVNSTDIMFGVSASTQSRIDFQEIERLCRDAEDIMSRDVFYPLVDEIKQSRSKMNKILNDVEREIKTV